MPSTLHQGLVWAFADDPELAFDLMREVFGLHVPPLVNITDRRSELDCFAPCLGDTHELRPDVALSGDRANGKRAGGLAVIVEVERRIQARKRWRMWVYWALFSERLRRTTALMLVAERDDVARWAENLGSREMPAREALLVLSRQNMPRVIDGGEARRRPSKALLSALLHARSDDIEVLSTALDAALQQRDDRRWRYSSAILATVSQQRKRQLEEGLTMEQRYVLTDLERNSIAFHDGKLEGLREGKLAGKLVGERQGKREGRREGKLEGKREGLIRLVLTILELRGLRVPAASKRRIRACTNLDTLERWATLAKQVTSVDELF